MACEKICPTQVITIERGKKEGRKTKIPLRYDFEMERCIFCEFCVESCGFDAIILNHQFELAAYNREDFSIGMLGKSQNMFELTPVGQVLLRRPGRGLTPHPRIEQGLPWT